MLVKNAGKKMQHSSIAVKSLDSGTVMFGVQLWLTSASCESRDTFSSLYPSFLTYERGHNKSTYLIESF